MEERKSVGFLSKILNFFSGSNPDSEKKRQMKEIVKSLNKQKFKFYRVKGEHVLTPLANFFYDIYKNITPAQVFLENAQNSSVLRIIVIDSFLSSEQLSLRDKLEETYIRQRAQDLDPKNLSNELKDTLVSYYAAFTSEVVTNIDKMYSLLLAFTNFVGFDYYFLLKKFDSGLPERDFKYHPKFEVINGEYVVDDLKDFLDLVPSITGGQDWDKLFDILKNYKSTEIIDRAVWKKMVKTISTVAKSRTLLLMVRHIEKDPKYLPESSSPQVRLVEDHLNKIKTQAEIILQKILKENTSKKIDTLLMKIFGTTAISRMKNYTERANITFAKKMLGGYIYTAPANYLKAFLLDYFKRDMKNLADILLIRGKWATQVASQQLSESFHSIMDISTRLIEFDEQLSEDGEKGQRFKKMLSRPDRDKNSITILRRMLGEVNDSVLKMMTETAQNLVIMGRSLKAVLEDYGKKDAEMIINWTELEASTDANLKVEIPRIYKKIYYFVQLLQFYIKKKK